MNNKYISFDWWWGGFNNIRMCYEMIGAMSYVSGRTIILPPPGYCLFLSEHDDKKTFFDIWEILDKDAFTSQFDCVEYADTSLTKYSSDIQNYDGICKDIKCILFEGDKDNNWGPQLCINRGLIYHNVESIKHFEEFSGKRDYLYNMYSNDEIIHFPRNLLGHFGYHVYPPNDLARSIIQQKVKDGVKFRNEFFNQAKNLMPNDYDAVHIRRGDFKGVHTQLVEDLYKNLNTSLEDKVRKSVPLYIATDETDYSIFDFLKEKYDIIFLKDLISSDYKTDLVLDTIICSNAHNFFGSRMSTYTDYINILRGYNNKIDNHRRSLNFDRKQIKYNKYPWEAEPYSWHDLWGELYYGKI